MATYTPNPDNAPNALTLFDDGSPPDASQFNPLFEGGLDLTANVRAWVSSVRAGNWSAPVSPGGGGVNNAMYAWDPLLQRWLAAVNEGGTYVLTSSIDGGKTWNTVHALTSQGSALSATNQSGYILVFEGGASGAIERVDVAGNFTSGTMGLANASGATLDYFHNQVTASGASVGDTNLFAFVQTGGNFVGHWLVGLDANGYIGAGNWTDVSTSLPAAFASGANHPGQFLVANTTEGQRTAVSGDIEAVALCGVTIGTDTPHLMRIVSNGAGSAATVTDVTSSLPAPGPPFIIGGLAYDAVNGLWGLLLLTGVTGTYLYTAPDLVTWTLAKHFVEYTGVQVQDGLAVAGGCWAVWMNTNSASSADGNGRVLYSWNVAQKGPASVWQAAYLSLSPGGAGELLSNGAGYLAGQTYSVSSAAKVAVSFGAGLSPGSNMF